MAAGSENPPEKFDDKFVRTVAVPPRGNRIAYDRGKDSVRGFGVRITAAGAKSFILNYTIAGRERRYTIGAYPAWTVLVARKEAARLRREIDSGHDPLGAREADREAPTVADLCDRYLAEHAIKKRTAADDESMIRRIVRPELGARKVASINFADVDRLHRKVTKASGGYAANRLLALLSKMFALAIRWEMRTDNPAKGVERNTEERRYRYLTGEELRRLTEALATHPNQIAANAVRLMLLTGARRGEVLSATWDQFDLDVGIWVKPSSHTKTKREHRVPISAPARQLLVEMRAEAEKRAKAKKRDEVSPFVFPARVGDGPMVEIKTAWAWLCTAAELKDVRVHDLRHTYASVLASAGLSLPVIGALLGHTQPGTTARYVHLFDDPLRAATERVGAIVTGKTDGAEVVPLERGRA
ncbi:MAG TPA: site-specific integrase [Stellaceae bacterium]|jgi:integrase|nr:site-specific integrase [Stellaceae bacterium]